MCIYVRVCVRECARANVRCVCVIVSVRVCVHVFGSVSQFCLFKCTIYNSCSTYFLNSLGLTHSMFLPPMVYLRNLDCFFNI